MNDHAYLYANMSDKSIMYDLAVHCALVEVPPVPGGDLKRILSSSPSPSRSRFKQRLRSSGCKISCCFIRARWGPAAARPPWRGWSWDRAWGDWEGGEALWVSRSTPAWDGAGSEGVRRGEALGWQHLTFHRLGLSQACSYRFQTDVKHGNTPS